jgi:HlyD family secretion protein
VGILVLVIGAVAFGLVRRSQAPTLQRTVVERLERGAFVREVSGTGVVEAAQERTLTFRTSGIVAEIFVAEGDRVEIGALLARQDTVALERDLALSRANLQSAQADLQRTLAQQEADRLDARNATVRADGALAAAQTELANAQNAFETAQQLRDVGGISRDEFEAADEALAQAVRRIDEARLSRDSAREREAALDQLAAAQRAGAEASVASIETTIATLGERIADAELIAPFAGVITSIDLRVGESAQPLSQEAMRLVDTSSLRVTAEFTENRAVDLTVGQSASIVPDADQRQRFEGVVERIGATARQTQGAAQVEVTFRFADSAQDAIERGLIKPGFNVDVRVVVNRVEDALLVPLQAISERDGVSWIFAIRASETDEGQGTVERVDVEVIDQNNTVAAVESASPSAEMLVALIGLDELEPDEIVRFDPAAEAADGP